MTKYEERHGMWGEPIKPTSILDAPALTRNGKEIRERHHLTHTMLKVVPKSLKSACAGGVGAMFVLALGIAAFGFMFVPSAHATTTWFEYTLTKYVPPLSSNDVGPVGLGIVAQNSDTASTGIMFSVGGSGMNTLGGEILRGYMYRSSGPSAPFLIEVHEGWIGGGTSSPWTYAVYVEFPLTGYDYWSGTNKTINECREGDQVYYQRNCDFFDCDDPAGQTPFVLTLGDEYEL